MSLEGYNVVIIGIYIDMDGYNQAIAVYRIPFCTVVVVICCNIFSAVCGAINK